jgi:protein-tyrosine phosphatase
MEKKICFVCLGNICRSPTAEGLARYLKQKESYEWLTQIDSAGTGAWHVGEAPHPTMRKVALQQGVDLSGLRARQVKQEDFLDFDYLIAMDTQNYYDLMAIKPENSHAEVIQLLPSVEMGEDVPDPYYGGEDGFLNTYRIIKDALEVFLRRLAGQ